MPLVQLSNLEKVLGDRLLFDRLNLSVERGERVGLIGDNGAGKSTLFRILMKQIEPDAGEVSFSRGATVAMLDQDPTFTPGQTLIDEAELAFADLHEMAHKLRDLEHDMAEHAGEDLDATLREYEALQHEFESAGGYAWRHKLEAILLGVGLVESDWGKTVDVLSGGQRSRLALAKMLVAEPDVLLLDEPTNHLDIAGVEWLENWLLGFAGAAVVVSHDRAFLDRVVTRVDWLTNRRLKSYPGNYAAFVKQREVETLSQQRAFEQQQARLDKEMEYIRRFQAGQRAKQARGRKTRLERFMRSDQVVEGLSNRRGMHLRFSTDQRAGDRVLKVKNLSIAFDGRQIWKDASFVVARGERIGIVGPNGAGKTTMLRALLGDVDADTGEIAWGANLTVAYYDQKLDDFDPDDTVYDELVSAVEGLTDQMARDALGAMLFSGDDVEKPMRLLSGGERARVALTKLLLRRPNVILLDEPTNHLDVRSCEALEKALSGYDGTLIVVSHDRYFLDRVVKRLLVIDPPAVRDFAGNWSDFRRKLADEKAEAQPKKSAERKPEPPKPRPTQAAPRDSKSKKDNPYKRPFGTLSVEQLEAKIAEVESDLGEAQLVFSDPAKMRNPDAAKTAQAQIEKLSRQLEELEAEYFSRGE